MADQLTEDLTSLKIDRDSGPRRGGAFVRVVVVLVLLAAVAAGGVAAWPYLEARLFKTEVQTTEVLSISPAQAATLLTSTGYVVPQRHTKVAAKLERRLARVLVHQGDVVTVALGFSRLSILVSFLFESFMLSLLGGVIGALASCATGLIEFPIVNFASFSETVFRFTPTPAILVSAMIFAGAMGLLGGFFPAVRAARVGVLEALRG